MAEALRLMPGDLVSARGREWVVLPSGDHPRLRLRPLSGSEADVQVLDPSLEPDGVVTAQLSWPEPRAPGSSSAAQLLADALLLSLRRGAGPFRCAAKLGFQPRAYQLVPLMMALRLDPVRLLIADGVGVGKTIEAGLIVRELVDRGEADRFTVLCPPHLVDQWTDELAGKFDFPCVAVTAASAARLERDLPAGESLFEAWPVTVVSLDYIKAARRRDDFMRACPDLVVVDEAHACVGAGQRRQQRFALLSDIASAANRHLILLTATPHSGVEDAFDRLVGLLDAEFGDGRGLTTAREQLARHFVQRRRIDITQADWGEERAFPRHETTEAVYRLNDDHFAFHEAVLDYCLRVATAPGVAGNRRRLAFWGTLALMRCVGSSPAAAASTLRNRLAGVADGADGTLESAEPIVFDEEDGDLSDDDVEPSVALDRQPLADAHQRELTALIRQAEKLDQARDTDPKLCRLVAVLRPLMQVGFSPVVFCRFMATADAVGEQLRAEFPRVLVEVVTGRLTPAERHARIASMGADEAAEDRRILVATDCLSEGINLQFAFDGVIHYDLCWNPTRHQQREGRVDRFGQRRPLVRSALLFAENSAIDGAVLDVILRKAEAIRSATGVAISLPGDRNDLASALLHAVLLRRHREPQQLTLDLETETAPHAARVATYWRDAEEGEKRSRTRFAQRPLRPAEVAEVWDRTQHALGGPHEVERFVDRALKRFDAPLEATAGGWQAPLGALPETLRDRLRAQGLSGALRLSFTDPAPGHVEVHRGHALVGALAEVLLEGALAPEDGDGLLPSRCGAWRTAAVEVMMTVVLLRLRHQITPTRPGATPLLAEEAGALAWRGMDQPPGIAGADALALLAGNAEGALSQGVIVRQIRIALERLRERQRWLDRHAEERAQALAADHAQVRAAARGGVGVRVEAALPVDVIGLYVLLPVVA